MYIKRATWYHDRPQACSRGKQVRNQYKLVTSFCIMLKLLLHQTSTRHCKQGLVLRQCVLVYLLIPSLLKLLDHSGERTKLWFSTCSHLGGGWGAVRAAPCVQDRKGHC